MCDVATNPRRYVYKLTFPDGKVYIGSTNDIEQRWRSGGSRYAGLAVYNAIQQFGWENIKKEVVLFLSNNDDLIKRVEAALILENEDNCYNELSTKRHFEKRLDEFRLIGAYKHVWTISGETLAGQEWCSKYGKGFSGVVRRIERYGLTPYEALTFPNVPREHRRDPVSFWVSNGFIPGKDETSFVTPASDWPSEYVPRSQSNKKTALPVT